MTTELRDSALKKKPEWFTIFFFIVLHIVAIFAAWHGFDSGFSKGNWILFVCLFFFSGLGVTIGFHRLATHEGFKCNKILKLFLYSGGLTATQMSIKFWVAKHRLHHKYSDAIGDPHSPREGFFWAHIGWMLFPYQYSQEELEKIVADLEKDRLTRNISRLFFVFAILGFVIPFLLFGWEGILLSSVLRLVAVYHVTFSVNSLCHMPKGFFVRKIYRHLSLARHDIRSLGCGILYVLSSPLWLPIEFILLFGSQNKWFKDDSRNNWLLAPFTLGESMHNNHHYDEQYPYHGVKWRDVDLSKWLIKILQVKIGPVRLVWDVRAPRQNPSK